jgi:two-component system, LuxR family, response regulator FixJ
VVTVDRAGGGSSMVYIVDDDEAVRQSLEWLLTSVDLEVRSFASAREFLAAYRPGRRACLVVDVRMPEMTGLELQTELAARSIELPVIVVTGHSDVQMAVRALDAGASEFLEKPLDDDALLNAIRTALERKTKRKPKRFRNRQALDPSRRRTWRNPSPTTARWGRDCDIGGSDGTYPRHR